MLKFLVSHTWGQCGVNITPLRESVESHKGYSYFYFHTYHQRKYFKYEENKLTAISFKSWSLYLLNMDPTEQTLWWQLTPQSHEDGKEDGGWVIEQMTSSCSPTGWAEVPIVTGLVTQGTHGKGILVVTHLFAAVTGVAGLGLCLLLSKGNKERMSHLVMLVALYHYTLPRTSVITSKYVHWMWLRKAPQDVCPISMVAGGHTHDCEQSAILRLDFIHSSSTECPLLPYCAASQKCDLVPSRNKHEHMTGLAQALAPEAVALNFPNAATL